MKVFVDCFGTTLFIVSLHVRFTYASAVQDPDFCSQLFVVWRHNEKRPKFADEELVRRWRGYSFLGFKETIRRRRFSCETERRRVGARRSSKCRGVARRRKQFVACFVECEITQVIASFFLFVAGLACRIVARRWSAREPYRCREPRVALPPHLWYSKVGSQKPGPCGARGGEHTKGKIPQGKGRWGAADR